MPGCSAGQDSYNTVAPETDAVVERTVEATGTVGYHEEYSVIPTVSGKILSCSVEEGDTVTAGQVLYVIDSGELEDQITQAQLSLSSAQASYSQAAAACDDLTVTAYASGTVTEVYVHVGDYVNTGTAIAALVDSGSLTLTVPFAADDAAAFAAGSTAVISFPGKAGTVSGTVTPGIRHAHHPVRRPAGGVCGALLCQPGRGEQRRHRHGVSGRGGLHGVGHCGKRHGAVHLRHPVRPGGLPPHPGGHRRHRRPDGNDH